MSAEKYQLCKLAGLSVSEHRAKNSYGEGDYQHYILANDVEHLLESALVVWICDDGKTHTIHFAEPVDPVKTAKLVCIEPFVRDNTADGLRKLLSEAANYLARSYPLMSHPDDEKYRADIADRARKLLERK
jgi:hypothetical protein